jgi:hypothetical protein
VLDDRDHATAMAQRAREFVAARTWERAGDQVEGALREFLASPRSRPPDPSAARVDDDVRSQATDPERPDEPLVERHGDVGR